MLSDTIHITILYDNTVSDSRLAADFGFSCLVAAHGKTILFDTGAKADILVKNMAAMGVDPSSIDMVMISHDHWDHNGGMSLVAGGRAPIYVPDSFATKLPGLTKIRDCRQISEGIYSTGELAGIEQSLVVQLGEEVVVVAGCAHSGVREILAAAGQFGKVAALVGGLHGFDELDLIADLKVVCPTHCTRKIAEIARRYPEKYVAGGAGAVMKYSARRGTARRARTDAGTVVE